MGSAGVLACEDALLLASIPPPNTFEIEPIELRRNQTLGSYMVANRRIEPEEVLIEESPLMLCPCVGRTSLGFICLTCFKITHFKCSVCTWPVCGRNCEKGKIHAEFECKVLAEKGIVFKNPKFDYTGIKVLRCLLLKEKDGEKWKLLLQHDAQLENRTLDLKTKEVRDHVLNFVLEECQLQNQFESTTVETVIGICATNEFCLTLNDHSRHAFLLFHKVSYLTHSCEPNLGSVWKFHPTQDSSYTQNYFSVKFFANRIIEPGEILTHSYMPETFSVVQRQDFLKSHYYFTCDCERCRKELLDEVHEPTEN